MCASLRTPSSARWCWRRDDEIGTADLPQIAALVARQGDVETAPEIVPQIATADIAETQAPPLVGADSAGSIAPYHPAMLSLLDVQGEARPLEEIEAEVIRFAVGHYRGQMSEVARRLQIGRSTLYRKLDDLGLGPRTAEQDSVPWSPGNTALKNDRNPCDPRGQTVACVD